MQGHAASAPGSRPSLSPLLNRHLAFASGGARSEQRPSLLGAPPLGGQHSGRQSQSTPCGSQGFSKRARFVTGTNSQPEPKLAQSTPAGQAAHISLSAPAEQRSRGASLLEEGLASKRVGLSTSREAQGPGSPPVPSGQGNNGPHAATVKYEHSLRGAASAPEVRSHGQPGLPASGSSLPRDAIRPEQQVAELAIHHTGSAAARPEQRDSPPGQPNRPSAWTNNQHISLQETYREPEGEPKEELPPHNAAAEPGSMPGGQTPTHPLSASTLSQSFLEAQQTEHDFTVGARNATSHALLTPSSSTRM